jgi:hypothetical protein
MGPVCLTLTLARQNHGLPQALDAQRAGAAAVIAYGSNRLAQDVIIRLELREQLENPKIPVVNISYKSGLQLLRALASLGPREAARTEALVAGTYVTVRVPFMGVAPRLVRAAARGAGLEGQPLRGQTYSLTGCTPLPRAPRRRRCQCLMRDCAARVFG